MLLLLLLPAHRPNVEWKKLQFLPTYIQAAPPPLQPRPAACGSLEPALELCSLQRRGGGDTASCPLVRVNSHLLLSVKEAMMI